MGAAPLLIVLVGMAFPIVMLLLAAVAGVFTLMWALYRFWHDEWSPNLRRAVGSIAHFPHPHLIHRH